MSAERLVEKIAEWEALPSGLASERPIVARLIGREIDALLARRFEAPFDARFGKLLLKTLTHLCHSFGATYGFCEHSEFSIYAPALEGEARRQLARIAGEAAGKLALLLGELVVFDVRLYELTSAEEARAYFVWRAEQHRSDALARYCARVLSSNGAEAQAIPHILDGLSLDERIELLRQNALDFPNLPTWQRLGAAVYRARPVGADPVLFIDTNLPEPPHYEPYVRRFVV